MVGSRTKGIPSCGWRREGEGEGRRRERERKEEKKGEGEGEGKRKEEGERERKELSSTTSFFQCPGSLCFPTKKKKSHQV